MSAYFDPDEREVRQKGIWATGSIRVRTALLVPAGCGRVRAR